MRKLSIRQLKLLVQDYKLKKKKGSIQSFSTSECLFESSSYFPMILNMRGVSLQQAFKQLSLKIE